MFFDGSLMKTGAGAGLLFISPFGKHLRYVLRLHFPASNNVAEYEALVNGLRIAIELGVRRLDALANVSAVGVTGLEVGGGGLTNVERGGLDAGGGMALIATKSAGSALSFMRLGLRRAAMSGSRKD